MPQISVIVPVCQAEAHLRRCVDSILDQSCRDFDLLLVDDGEACSCREYEDLDPRIRVIRQNGSGSAALRNAGLRWICENSDARWICFVGCEDCLHRDFLRLLLESARKENARMAVCSQPCPEDFDGNREFDDLPVTTLDAQQAYCTHYEIMAGTGCRLYDRDLFETLRFPEGRLYEDAYISHILTFGAGRIALVELPLCLSRTIRPKWSPRSLDEVEAHELRLPYLSSRGYQEAYRRELEVYIQKVYSHAGILAGLTRNHPRCREYLKILRRKLRSAMRAGKKLGLYPRTREFLQLHLMAGCGLPLWRGLRALENRKRRTA